MRWARLFGLVVAVDNSGKYRSRYMVHDEPAGGIGKYLPKDVQWLWFRFKAAPRLVPRHCV